MFYDVIIVGGSYAGMAAALQLVRARRSVLVIDAGQRRNRFAAHSHGFLSQDGSSPDEIVRTAREQLIAYPDLTWVDGRATSAAGEIERFSVTTETGGNYRARRLILATGVVDTLPDVPGLQELWGRNVFHCPYCHGFETNKGQLGVLAVSAMSMHQALMIPDWGRTTFFTNSKFEPDAEQLAALSARDVSVERATVERVSGKGETISVHLEDGRTVELAGLFTMPRTDTASPIAEQLGCAFEDGPLGAFIRVDAMKATSVPGVYAAGDNATMAGSVTFAVADGARAGTSAHQSIIPGLAALHPKPGNHH
ncbi:NAD(P)/FAD-dependent oxidoreductase [Aquamicrobium sp.]|uniref:NAD(P)/FAD-dependent oxidoreductase n=1 Tax=Aquamicrobium sp. TaxID=1872579 RepID=UPI002588DC16|nr:NAD(P)/FAD-dependent oxidoreductase [Aquamicrobium sp.]MCK9553321.1 NAD(P)/FAD-dependent oxidoreductase [Aquamicrobium sp.]